jgi:acid phosphatase
MEGSLRRAVLAGLLPGLLLLGACAQPGVPVLPAEPTPNLGLLKQDLLRYQASGAYERDLAAVAGEAARYLEELEIGGARAAIVLDIDETSLSNWPYLVANDVGRIMHGPCDLPEGPCGWVPWAEMADAAPIEPTLEVARLAAAIRSGPASTWSRTARPSRPPPTSRRPSAARSSSRATRSCSTWAIS